MTIWKNLIVDWWKNCFNVLIFFIRKKWAVTDNFESLSSLWMDLGVEDLQRHISNPKVTYLSSTSVTEMIHATSDNIELASLRGQNIALLADESTDSANWTQLVMLYGGLPDHYLGLINVSKTTAEALMQAIHFFHS